MSNSERFDPHHPDLAEEFLKVAEWSYGSVSGYQECWSQIHPQDRVEWLESFRQIAEDLKQLAHWRSQGKLASAHLKRLSLLEEQRRCAQPTLERLGEKPRDSSLCLVRSTRESPGY